MASPSVAYHLRDRWPRSINVIECPVVQPGPVMSALLASAYMQADEPVLIVDGDLIYSPHVIPLMLAPLYCKTRLIVSPGFNKNWCRVEFDGDAVKMTERGGGVVGATVMAGGYGFRSWSLFMRAGCTAVALALSDGKMEPKMSNAIMALQDCSPVIIRESDWTSVGTPEEYDLATQR